VLKGASRKQKNEIDMLAGLKRTTINRTYVTGTISAKVAISIAQILGISPFYLTAEADEPGKCTDKTLNEFLVAKGYANETNYSAADNTKPAALRTTEESAPPPAKTPAYSPLAAPSIPEDEAAQLLRALYIRAKYSAAAAQTLSRVTKMLTHEG
jgi:hypothetical protein